MKDKGYVHRDIKLDNILITQKKPIKIILIDFGLSQKINREKLEGTQGTAGYMAPEIFRNQAYTEKSDVYSLGIVFYILLTGKPPFKGQTYSQLLQVNKKNKITFSGSIFSKISWNTLITLQNMFKDSIKQRYNLVKVMKSLSDNIKQLREVKNGYSNDIFFENLALPSQNFTENHSSEQQVSNSNQDFNINNKGQMLSMFLASYHSFSINNFTLSKNSFQNQTHQIKQNSYSSQLKIPNFGYHKYICLNNSKNLDDNINEIQQFQQKIEKEQNSDKESDEENNICCEKSLDESKIKDLEQSEYWFNCKKWNK